MKHKVTISSNQAKIISGFTSKEKSSLVKAVDSLESMGQMGEPLFREMNVWKYRIDDIRIIYKITPQSIRILRVLRGISK